MKAEAINVGDLSVAASPSKGCDREEYVNRRPRWRCVNRGGVTLRVMNSYNLARLAAKNR
jgi:hypothetical protein